MTKQQRKTKNEELAENRAKVQQHIQEHQPQSEVYKAWISDYDVKEDGEKVIFEIQSTQGDTENMEVETTNNTGMSAEAQILESYTDKPITKPDMYEGTELYRTNLYGKTVFCLPKNKKLAEIAYENSPNQRIARFLIASQQFFVSSVVMTLVATIVATSFILLENTIGTSEVIPAILLVSGLALATLPAFALSDLKRRL